MLWILAAAALCGAIFMGIGMYFYNYALNPRWKKPSLPPEADGQPAIPRDAWLTQHTPREVWISSFDGLRLHAYLVENGDCRRFALCCHGWCSNAKSLSHMAGRFYEQGYSVLLPDARGHGDSQGSYIGMGWHDRLDTLAWARWLETEYHAPRTVLYGVSMGGATVLMAAGEPLPPCVKCVVEDCGFTSAREEFRFQLGVMFHRPLPAGLILPAADAVCRLRAGYSLLREADALPGLRQTRLPILFLHGDADRFVPVSMAYRAYEAAGGQKTLCIIPGAGHARACRTDPAVYWGAVFRFCSQYITE